MHFLNLEKGVLRKTVMHLPQDVYALLQALTAMHFKRCIKDILRKVLTSRISQLTSMHFRRC